MAPPHHSPFYRLDALPDAQPTVDSELAYYKNPQALRATDHDNK